MMLDSIKLARLALFIALVCAQVGVYAEEPVPAILQSADEPPALISKSGGNTKPDLTPIEFNPLNLEVPSFEVNAAMLQQTPAKETPTAMLSTDPSVTETDTAEGKQFKIYVNEDHELNAEEGQEGLLTDEPDENPSKLSSILSFMKGEPAESMVAFGMWSRHFNTDKEYRENNNLFGLQYKGVFASTFANSHSKQTVAVGIARTVYERPILFNKVRYTLGYKIGPMYGYTNKGVPNIAGFSVLPMLVNGFSMKHYGVDFNIVPGNAVSLNLHAVDPRKFDEVMEKKQKHKPVQKASRRYKI